MARKGEQAREAVNNTIIQTFTDLGALAGVQDKKIYVNMPDGPGGEVLPKTPVTGGGTPTGGLDWSAQSAGTPTASTPVSTELSSEDKAKVEALMAQLGTTD